MAVHSKESRVLINDSHLSGTIKQYTVTHARAMADVTTILDTGMRCLPGLLGGSVSLAGLFDSAAGSIHEEVTAAAGVDNGLLVTVLPDGFTIGKPAFFAATDLENYQVNSTVTDAVQVQVDAPPDDGVDWGVSLHGHSAETADGQATSVDNAASSSGGAVAALHVTAYSGLTNVVFKVQHSVDDAVWADLITFTTVAGTTYERKTTTGTVNRYLRASWDVTGTGSVTFVIAAARR